MSLYDTWLLDGTDIKSLAGVRIADERYEAPYAAASFRGDSPRFPGVDGEEDVDLPLDSMIVPLSVWVDSETQEQQNDRFRALRRACKPRRLITLTRRMELTAGNEDHTAAAKLEHISVDRMGPTLLRAVLEFKVKAGCFYGASTNIPALSGATTILGDARTEKMTITLAAGGSVVEVSNSTNGYEVTYTGTVPAGGVVIDVEARTATGITGSVDLSRYLVWNKRAPFRLEPGSNTLTDDGGTATIDYQPAYL